MPKFFRYETCSKDLNPPYSVCPAEVLGEPVSELKRKMGRWGFNRTRRRLKETAGKPPLPCEAKHYP